MTSSVQVNGRLAQARLRAFPPPPLLRYPARRPSGSAVSWYSFDTNTVPSTQRNSSALARVIAAVTSGSQLRRTQYRRISDARPPQPTNCANARRSILASKASPPRFRHPRQGPLRVASLECLHLASRGAKRMTGLSARASSPRERALLRRNDGAASTHAIADSLQLRRMVHTALFHSHPPPSSSGRSRRLRVRRTRRRVQHDTSEPWKREAGCKTR
ncbi:hypothetical protein C8J57DRAFT_1722880 [Mycena rebaudengoi]|nr:hypothetical protein C8J57DRAFT_1722880 [Mycena rebaudengoi]